MADLLNGKAEEKEIVHFAIFFESNEKLKLHFILIQIKRRASCSVQAFGSDPKPIYFALEWQSRAAPPPSS